VAASLFQIAGERAVAPLNARGRSAATDVVWPSRGGVFTRSSSSRSCARRFSVLVGVACLLLARSASAAFDWGLPMGFPTPKVSADNPPSVEKIALGRFLFYDARLSGNLTQSCASCHRQALAFTDGLPLAIGSTGDVHPRNSMSLTNAGYASTLAWASDILVELEQQALVPMFGEDPVELGLTGLDDELLARLRADGRYRRLFAEAFPDDSEPIQIGNLVRALTSFVRSLISGHSPYDRFVQGIGETALSRSAQRGGRLFFTERLECFHCHGGFNFALNTTFAGQAFDESAFQNNGLYNIDGEGAYPPDNTGLFERTRLAEDMGAFKAPTLRNIELTGPYMHDGSIATLEEVLDHYMAGGRRITSGPFEGDGRKNPFKDNFVRGFSLTAEEREDVLNFLKALTDEGFTTRASFADPFTTPSCAADCNLDSNVAPTEIIGGIEAALEQGPLSHCVSADRDGDGAVTIEELTAAATSLSQGCPPAEGSETLRIGSTQPGGGELSLASGLTPAIVLVREDCVGGAAEAADILAACQDGLSPYRAVSPGFAALTERGMSPLYPLLAGTAVTLQIHTAIAPRATLMVAGKTLAALADSVDLGAAPDLAQQAQWSFSWPQGSAPPRQVTLWFQLVSDNPTYRPSQPIAAVLLLEDTST